MDTATKKEQPGQKLFLKEQLKKLQKLQEIIKQEIKQLIKLFKYEKQKVKKKR